MSLLTKSLSIFLQALFLHLIPLLQIKAIVLDTTSSLRLTNTIHVGNNETDFHALLAFKSSVFPEYQHPLSSWNESLHFCHWEGIKCGSRHERVTVVDLTSRGLTGALSPLIGNLSFLRELTLSNNTFIGEIPTVLGNLFRLQKLNLSYNGFEGKIPTSLSLCSNLMFLDLSRNTLVAEFPKELAYSMLRLVYLNIVHNNFTGGIPPWIGNLTSLEIFGAAYNPFGGRIPSGLGQLKSLRTLALAVTQISGTIAPSLYNLSSLAVLSLSYNQLRGSLPSTLGFMFPQLEMLDLNNNQFHGPLPLSISNSSKLARMQLGNNSFSGKVRIDFRNLQSLYWISLARNNFATNGSDGLAFLGSLANCSNLKIVDLEDGQFGGVLPVSVGNLSTTLSLLILGYNQLNGYIPSTIENLVGLEVLALNQNLLTGPIPGNIGYLHKLQKLDFSDNNLPGKIPNTIGNLSLLIELRLEKNKLEGAIPLNLENCQNLLLLALSGNNLNGSIPRQIFTVSSLSIALDLSHNHFSGSLPLEVGNLKHLTAMDLSNNRLSGEIPPTLGSCSSLEILYLFRNFFQGSILSKMESLRAIQTLDLSQNNFSGQIPRFFGTFTLKNLNLSFNNFEGELPIQGVFTNSSAISVVGNPRLCGGISKLRLPPCGTKKSSENMSLSQIIGITIASVLVGVTVVSSVIIFLFKKKRKTKPTVSLLKDPFLKISYGELLKATECFSLTNLLGIGSVGRVYKGVLEQNGELAVAVKVLDLQIRGATKSFMAECEALKNIRHRNLVSIITSCSSTDFQGNDFKALVYEFMANGSLDNWLHPIPEGNNGEQEFVGLNLLQRINIGIDVACALDYLHLQCERSIIHGDLKPSNILLDGDMVAHIGDFGLARFRVDLTSPSTSSSTVIRGTIGYAPPEYGMGSEMSTSGDIYSYGILLLEMITRKRPTDSMFDADLNLHNYAKIALPQRVIEIVDPMLLIEEIDGSKMTESLITLIKIGLACSTEFPKDRMDINTALCQLHLVKKSILKTESAHSHFDYAKIQNPPSRQ